MKLKLCRVHDNCKESKPVPAALRQGGKPSEETVASRSWTESKHHWIGAHVNFWLTVT